MSDSQFLLEAAWRMDEAEVARRIDTVHMENTSILSYNDENSLSCIITLAFYAARNEYQLIRELPSGKGYADVVFVPRPGSDKMAMIVELKWDKSASGALEQILEKKYPTVLQDYLDRLLLIGINYDKEAKKHECVIKKYS